MTNFNERDTGQARRAGKLQIRFIPVTEGDVQAEELQKWKHI